MSDVIEPYRSAAWIAQALFPDLPVRDPARWVRTHVPGQRLTRTCVVYRESEVRDWIAAQATTRRAA